MREILFRGKAINRVEGREYRTNYKNGDWVYGLVTSRYVHPLLPAEMRNENGILGIEVDYKTIGQYTGLTDKNGTKIFEGDIVQYELHDIRNTAVIKYGAPKEDSFCYGWYLDDNYGNTAFLFSKVYIKTYNYTIIGNIYDDPELIGGKTNG